MVLTYAQARLNQCPESVDALIIEGPIAEIQNLFIDKVETSLEPTHQLRPDEYPQHIHSFPRPLGRLSDLLIQISLLMFIVRPELAADHVQLVGLEHELIGECGEGASSAEGQEVLGVGGVEEVVVEVFLVREGSV